jgi:general L-amino acid transport system substrate-binding protein
MKKYSLLGLGAGILAVLSMAATPVLAQQTLELVQKRGHLRCQVGTPSPGFYQLAADGTWSGSDVSVCRAVATAIFGDPNKVEFQSVTSAVRFTALANGESDMLSGLDFAAINFYDGQGFMVPKDSGIKSAFELKGATVCVLTGTTTELNLADFSRANNLEMQPVVFEDANVRNDTYLKGGCDAITNDKSGLASNKAGFPNPDAHTILPETISKEPLAPAVRQNDSQWMTLVRWVVFALIGAEELGINSGNVDQMRSNPPSPEHARFLGVEGDLNKGLGLSKDWAYNIIKKVGNYGEIYDTYMGDGSPAGIGIPRAGSANALWTEGGLMYSPPFR